MKPFIMTTCFLLSISALKAQSKLTREQVQKDSVIKIDIIDPAVREAQGAAPDWKVLTDEIAKKYDATYADRTVTKGIIYYSYGKDQAAFTAAIVKYTDKYEPKDNLKLLNKNAGFILKWSENKDELEAAQRWSKITIDGDSTNADYKKTYDALTAKIASL